MASGTKRAFDVPRQNLFMFDPDDLCLVTDPSDSLYDKRVNNTLDTRLLANIRQYGIIQPIKIIKREGIPVVTVGRQRVRCAREIKKEQGAAGAITIKVPAVLDRRDVKGCVAIMISENEIRQGDSISTKAEKLQHLLSFGHTMEDATVLFGVSRQTLGNWLAVLEVCDPVRKAIENGEASASIAPKLVNLPKAEQLKALHSAKVAGGGKRITVKSVAHATGGKPKMRSRKEVERRLTVPNVPADYAKALKWVLGETE